ncbi:YqeG family HAD IIIA-type phosphatase [Streptococcus sp. DD13]|uniref:YqeG family HAD IIIA-type phosphatase n=1 Tax=Streptococcus sp. DD13 TaxID=1777881 RepID=UPI0007995E81|nr:YqeG family HAD IIIA-type phosphatase [Streptococcus sp. DD13]KXT78096.1 Hydrolase, HAD subfamily IIIA [Streptococcus sp. DD13]
MTIENYLPDFVLEKAYDVTVESLKQQQIKAVFVDLDNTLIAWNNPDGTPEMRQWLAELQDAGIRVVVVSNNSPKRVQRAVERFGIPFEAHALKPFTFGLKRAMKRFGIQPQEVVMIGDQLMTDIRAAKRAGIRSILVKPLVETDSVKTKFNRWRERRVMKRLAASYGPLKYKRKL